MAGKRTGLGDNYFLDGFDLSGDTQSIGQIAGGPRATQDVTGINKKAHERRGLRRDGNLAWVAFFNPATDQAHEVLSALPTGDRIATYFNGTTIGNQAASCQAKQLNYDPSRSADGQLTIAVAAMANEYGLEWGAQLTNGIRTDTGATNGTGLDLGGGGSKAFGLQAWLHVFSFTGTDATIKLQGSSDNGAGDAYADVVGGGFTQITAAPFSQRIQTARNQSVEQWIRAVTVTTGGFSSMAFAVMVTRNEETVNY